MHNIEVWVPHYTSLQSITHNNFSTNSIVIMLIIIYPPIKLHYINNIKNYYVLMCIIIGQKINFNITKIVKNIING